MELTVGSLFSGIGGIDSGFSRAGFCVLWAIEKDEACCKTYAYNYPDTFLIKNDIKLVDPKALPKVDVLIAGFPCQPFSIAGKQRGFSDNRGNLFFDIISFTRVFMPRFVFLENVANLTEHNNGKTFIEIHSAFAALGYILRYRVLRASDYGNIPQIRDRIYIVAFRDQTDSDRFVFPDKTELTVNSDDIINRHIRQHSAYYYSADDYFFKKAVNIVKDKNSIYRVYHDSIKPVMNRMCPTLTASMGTSENQTPLIIDDFGIRRLTIKECLGFQGFPDSFHFPHSITLNDAYKQVGNSVCIPVVERIAKNLLLLL